MLRSRQDQYETVVDLISRLALAGLAIAMLILTLAGFLAA